MVYNHEVIIIFEICVLIALRSLVSNFAPTDNVHMLIFLRNIGEIICSVSIISVHREILKPKYQSPGFSSNWVVSLSSSICKINSSILFDVTKSKPFYCSGQKMLRWGSWVSKHYALFFLLHDCWWSCPLEMFVICFRN